jgi:hypothetical protein
MVKLEVVVAVVALRAQDLQQQKLRVAPERMEYLQLSLAIQYTMVAVAVVALEIHIYHPEQMEVMVAVALAMHGLVILYQEELHRDSQHHALILAVVVAEGVKVLDWVAVEL